MPRFTTAFAAALTFLEPGNDVAWANEAVPLLGSGPALPLWMSMAVADWLVKLAIAFGVVFAVLWIAASHIAP